jgi:hypothetical protein
MRLPRRARQLKSVLLLPQAYLSSAAVILHPSYLSFIRAGLSVVIQINFYQSFSGLAVTF